MEKRLTDLGRPEYIDHKMFHNLIEDWYSFSWSLCCCRWGNIFSQKEKTLELNQKINTAMNNLKFWHFLSHEFRSPHVRWEALQYKAVTLSASCMVQEELGKPIPKVQASQVIIMIIHHQRANQACNQACCHVGILLTPSHLVLCNRCFRRLRFSVWPACMRRNC